MMNLLGCTKKIFIKLMTYMNYKKDKTEDIYIFKGEKRKRTSLLNLTKKKIHLKSFYL